jgi:DNA polymerase-3 subunit alpha
MKSFTHLHVHSEYSLLDGSAKIKELIATAKACGMESLAITDHGVMFGVIDFYKAAKDAGIKPILGCEVYVAPDSRFNKEKSESAAYYHLVLLAENETGYKNLIKLVSLGFTEGFYYRPRVDYELLSKYHEGLIALSACGSGAVARAMMNISYDHAKKQALRYDSLFGRGNFYLELQEHGLPYQAGLNQDLMRLSKETGIPLVATNDIHYISRDDAEAHEVLLCIQTGKTLLDEDRMKYEADQFYMKTTDEMYALFSYAHEALENTQKIADRCHIEIEFNKYKLPIFELPEDHKDAYGYLKFLCETGLAERYGPDVALHNERLNFELDTIHNMGFVDYFLIVWDFIKYARDNGIMVGPGRGSGAGSIVAYSLRITDVDPIEYNLIFERFLNPDRITMPDFDIDFCYERRQEVIEYVNRKYGTDHVSQIITFGTMKARAATRDVGRALAMPYADVDRIAKMIPSFPGSVISIADALGMNPELKEAYDTEDDTKVLLDMSMRLEGLPRHASTHAAGVVICDKPVDEYVPLNVNDGLVTTQFPMGTVEELGLLKMDFLGLRTLTVIRKAAEEARRSKGVEIDLDHWKYDDPKVYELITQAKTEGVFQLESSGMKSFMTELKPNNLEDVIAGISLYRPGPMDFIPKYIKGKNNPKKITYTHISLAPILEATYGCIVYQEQVMQIVRDLAGYSMARSDLVRRAMSKKIGHVMDEERKNFIYGLESDNVPGCIKNGIPEKVAGVIFDEMVDFAKYAFNKSHAAAYAVVSYQTAWLKYYYPVEFMAAIMTSVMDFTPKIVEYIHECKKMGITLLPPDINEGFGHFSVSGNQIRFGLSAIKNVGRAAVEAIALERERNGKYRGITDFIRRMENGEVNKRCMESLIKAGAFDSLGGRRSQYMAAYLGIMNGMSQTRKSMIEGQLNLFEMEGAEEENVVDDLPNISELLPRILLNNEREVLGVYVSGHPLSDYEPAMKPYVANTSLDFLAGDEAAEIALKDGESVRYGGMIMEKSVKYTKAGNRAMAFLTVEDLYGTVEVIVFSNLYEKYGLRLVNEQVLVIQGKVSVREEEDAKIIANEFLFYEDIQHEPQRIGSGDSRTVWIKIPKDSVIKPSAITDILQSYRGDTRVYIYNEKLNQKLALKESLWVSPCHTLVNDLENVLGNGAVKITEKKMLHI